MNGITVKIKFLPNLNNDRKDVSETDLCKRRILSYYEVNGFQYSHYSSASYNMDISFLCAGRELW